MSRGGLLPNEYLLVGRVLRRRDLVKRMTGSGMEFASIRKRLIAFREYPPPTRIILLGALSQDICHRFLGRNGLRDSTLRWVKVGDRLFFGRVVH